MTHDDNAQRARAIYDAAQAHFDAAPLTFWNRYSSRTVERMQLSAGARVLDVCSGSGSSAIAAARTVGPTGAVVAVDISSPLLALAQRKASSEALANIEFRVNDMARLRVDEHSFDAAVIVFGLFFADDMVEQLRLLARTIRPGGKLAVTIWGPRLFEPLYSVFRAAVEEHRPFGDAYRPWDRVTSTRALADLFERAGLHRVELVEEAGTCPLGSPEDFWTIVLGSGLRGFVDGLDHEVTARIHDACAARARTVDAIETNVIYAIATL